MKPLCQCLWATILVLSCAAVTAAGPTTSPEEATRRLAPFFRPPPEFADDLGKYRSPLLFEDGKPVRSAADWLKRRQEILKDWHDRMGAWPALIDRPKIDYLEKERRDGLTQ